MNCTKCNSELPNTALFCPNCGDNINRGMNPSSKCKNCGSYIGPKDRFYPFKDNGGPFCLKCMKCDACGSEARGDVRILRANGTVLCQACAKGQGVKLNTNSQQLVAELKKTANGAITNFLITFGVVGTVVGAIVLVLFIFVFETNIADYNSCTISGACIVTNFSSAIAIDSKYMMYSAIATIAGILMLIDGLFRKSRHL